jgi:hypothetical protein
MIETTNGVRTQWEYRVMYRQAGVGFTVEDHIIGTTGSRTVAEYRVAELTGFAHFPQVQDAWVERRAVSPWERTA